MAVKGFRVSFEGVVIRAEGRGESIEVDLGSGFSCGSVRGGRSIKSGSGDVQELGDEMSI